MTSKRVGSTTSFMRRRVDDEVVEGEVGELARYLPPHLEEQPVGELEDVRLVHQRHAPPPLAPRQLERVAHDPLRAVARDDGDRLGGAAPRPHVVLDARVDVLGVLAHHDEIDAAEARRHAGQSPRRAHVGVEVEALPERHVHRAKTLAHRRGERPLERHAVRLDRRHRRLGERIAQLVDGAHAGELLVPRELGAHRVERAQRGVGDLGADPVAAQERDPRRHAQLVRARRPLVNVERCYDETMIRACALIALASGCYDLSGLSATPDLSGGPADGGATGCQGSTAILCEDFESGAIDPTRWSTTMMGGTVTVTKGNAHSGSYALSASVTPGLQSAVISETSTFAQHPNNFYVRAFVRITSTPFPTADLIDALQSTTPNFSGLSIGYIDDNPSDQPALITWNDFGSNYIEGGAPYLTHDAWHCVVWLVLGAPSGEVRVWIDGAEVAPHHLTGLPIESLDKFEIGVDTHPLKTAQPAGSALFDDIVIDTQPPSCG
jgi:hypothetical protein